MKYKMQTQVVIFLIALLCTFAFVQNVEGAKKTKKALSCNEIVKELQKIIEQKNVNELIKHISPDGVEMIATVNPENWTKKKVVEYLTSKEPNNIQDFFFKDLPEEFKCKGIDISEDKKGCSLDSNLNGKAFLMLSLKIKKSGNTWFITAFGYIG